MDENDNGYTWNEYVQKFGKPHLSKSEINSLEQEVLQKQYIRDSIDDLARSLINKGYSINEAYFIAIQTLDTQDD